jgi:PmbA protein
VKQEFITIREKEIAARIQNTRINAIRTKDIVRKGVRVYAKGTIGISGAIGQVSEDVLVEDAIQNLSTGISYPYALSKKRKDHRNYNDNPISSEELISITESVLETLRQEYADFDFSQTIYADEILMQMRNSEGLDLEYKDAYYSLELILKEKKSANLIDGFLICVGRQFDLDDFWAFNHSYLEAYRNPVALPEGEVLPVFMLAPDNLLDFLNKSLNGERFATGSSLFSGKLGEQLFSEKVTVEQNRNPSHNPGAFFDMEGVVLPEDRYALIETGKLVGVFADKKNASLYNLPHTGSASGAYDDMPTLTTAPLYFRTDSQDLKSALSGQPAILVMISSGGEFTPDGSFAAPVQVSFLFDGEKIIGKLPEFTMRSHLYKMLGEDYIGTFDNTVFYLGDFPSQLQGYYMTIMK